MLKNDNNKHFKQLRQTYNIGMAMLGVLTPYAYVAWGNTDVKASKALVFHAPEVKGKAMQELVISGFLQGTLNVTTK